MLKKIMSNTLVVSSVFFGLNIDSLASNYTLSISEDVLKSTSENIENLAVGEWLVDIPISPISSGTVKSVNYLNGKLYFMVGSGSSYKMNIYDIESKTWEEVKTNMPTYGNRREFLSAVVGDTIYYVCGGDEDGISVGNVDAYNTTNGTWEAKSSSTMRSYGGSITVVGEKIYIFGGVPQIYDNESNEIAIYDTVSDTWENKVFNSGTPRTNALSFAIDDSIYYVGGDASYWSKGSGIVEVYNIKTDTWETKANLMVEDSSRMSGFILNNKICVYGNRSAPNSMYEYNISTDEWVAKGNKPNANIYGFNTIVIDGFVCNFTSNNTVDIYRASKPETQESIAEDTVILAEETKSVDDISEARSLVNSLPESIKKDELNNRLNLIYPKIEKSSSQLSANTDLYIKMSNVLSLSLDTNSVVFEDFTGVEDMVKENAINLTVESSLPYEVNTSLETEIENLSGTSIVDRSVLGIKSNTENDYNVFSDIKSPIVLLDNQEAGRVNTHGIDLKLNKNIISKADVYKTTIKFEVKQK